MNAKELAALLNGREYLQEMTVDEAKQAHAAGLIVIYNGSDDLVYFAGAISDELGANDGGKFLLTSKGLVRSECDEGENCPYFEKLKAGAAVVEALWCKEPDYSWTYKTAIPHETFEIVEDGFPYCRGIVFALADVKGIAE